MSQRSSPLANSDSKHLQIKRLECMTPGRWIWPYNIWLSIRLDAIVRWNIKRIFLFWKLVLVLPGRQVPHATCRIIITRHIMSSLLSSHSLHKRTQNRCYHKSKQTYVRVITKLPNTKARGGSRGGVHKIPQKFSHLPPFGAIFLSAPPLTWNPESAPEGNSLKWKRQTITENLTSRVHYGNQPDCTAQ